MRVIVTVSALLILGGSPCLGATIYVDQDGGGDYLTIQEGIDAAAFDDTVLVASGTYTEQLVIAKPLSLLSESGPDVTTIQASQKEYGLLVTGAGSVVVSGFTILPHPNTSESNSVHVYHSEAEITGCIFPTACVRQIYCNNSGYVLIADNPLIKGKKAVQSDTSNIEVVNNVITGTTGVRNKRGTSVVVGNTINTGNSGTGVYMHMQQSMLVTDNVITAGSGISLPSSAGIVARNTVVSDTTNIGNSVGIRCYGPGHTPDRAVYIQDNDVSGGTAGIMTYGVGRYVLIQGNVVRNAEIWGLLIEESSCRVVENEVSHTDGDGVFVEFNSSPLILGNYIHDNSGEGLFCTVLTSPDSIIGNRVFDNDNSGIFCQSNSPLISGNVVVGNQYGINCASTGSNEISWNTAAGNTYGIYISSSTPDVHHNIVAFNTGVGFACTGLEPTFWCNNSYGNQYGNYSGSCSDPTGTDGNISLDPCFCEDSYMIAEASPCAPDNSPEGCGLIGALGIGCGDCGYPVPVVPTSWGELKSLFR